MLLNWKFKNNEIDKPPKGNIINKQFKWIFNNPRSSEILIIDVTQETDSTKATGNEELVKFNCWKV